MFKVGAKSLETGVFGAYCNVMINLRDVKDDEYSAKVCPILGCVYTGMVSFGTVPFWVLFGFAFTRASSELFH